MRHRIKVSLAGCSMASRIELNAKPSDQSGGCDNAKPSDQSGASTQNRRIRVAPQRKTVGSERRFRCERHWTFLDVCYLSGFSSPHNQRKTPGWLRAQGARHRSYASSVVNSSSVVLKDSKLFSLSNNACFSLSNFAWCNAARSSTSAHAKRRIHVH